MTGFVVEVDAQEVDALLARVNERVSQPGLLSFLVVKALPEMRHRMEARFGQEGDDASGKWPSLAFATGRIRAHLGFGSHHPINVRTGSMRRHVMSSFRVGTFGSKGAQLNIPGTSGNRLMANKLRTAQQGGYTKQSGNKAGPNRPVPARPILAVSERDAVTLNDNLLAWIRAGSF